MSVCAAGAAPGVRARTFGNERMSFGLVGSQFELRIPRGVTEISSRFLLGIEERLVPGVRLVCPALTIGSARLRF